MEHSLELQKIHYFDEGNTYAGQKTKDPDSGLLLRYLVEPDKEAALLRETYGSKIKVFGTEIPHSVRAKEISAEGKSIFAHDSKGKVAAAYTALVKEVIALEQRNRNRPGAERGL